MEDKQKSRFPSGFIQWLNVVINNLGILFSWLTGHAHFILSLVSFLATKWLLVAVGCTFFFISSTGERLTLALRQKEKISPNFQKILPHISLARIREYFNFWINNWQVGGISLRPIRLLLVAEGEGCLPWDLLAAWERGENLNLVTLFSVIKKREYVNCILIWQTEGPQKAELCQIHILTKCQMLRS